MKKTLLTALLMMTVMLAGAQSMNPVQFKAELKKISATEAEIVFTGKIAQGWHVYSTNLGNEGPISATFNVDKKDGVVLVGTLKGVGKEINKFDQLFGMQLRFFENDGQFVQKVKLTKKAFAISGYLEYGACNDESCLPPAQVPFNYKAEAGK